MYCGKITPWEHYPKNLRFHEVQNPLKVVIDFFSSGLPKEHRKDLKEWRHYVTSDEHYKGERHGPGTLLFHYDLAIKFMEAMHLLLCEYQDKSWNYKKADNAQIATEREKWVYFPRNLSNEELANPYIAVKKCFKTFKPQDYRDHLHEWLHTALYNNAVEETLTPGEVIKIYENLVKLYSAGWLIHQRETDETYFKRNVTEVPNGSDTEMEEIKLAPFLKSGIDFTTAEELALSEIKDLILKRIPYVKTIIALGARNNSTIFYLAVLIDDHQRMPEHEVANKIEDHCRQLIPVFAFVSKISSARNAVNAGKRFWNNVFLYGIIVYNADKVQLPTPTQISESVLLERSKNDWNRWGIQGKQFFNGADFFIKNGQNIVALFMLHQAVESTLIAIIRVFCGYRPSAHNLGRMVKITMLLVPDIEKVFNKDLKLFSILQSGYTEARYKNEFGIENADVVSLYELVNTSLLKIEQIFELYITQLEASKLIINNTPLDEQTEAG